MNFDGSSYGNPGPTGFRHVGRDANRNVVFMVCGALLAFVIQRRLQLGLLYGLRMLKELGI